MCRQLASDMDHDKWENPRETEDDEQVGGSQYPFNDLAAAAGHNDSATHSRAKRSASGQTGRPKSVADGAQKTTRRPPKGAKRVCIFGHAQLLWIFNELFI